MRVALRRLFRLSNPPVGAMRPEPRPRGWSRRFKIMLRHTGLMVTLVVLLCGGVGAIAYHIATQPTELTIAVGPPNSEDTRVVQSIAAQLAREQFNIRLQTKVLDGGPPAAAAAIDNGQADLAVVRRDAGMPKNGQAVAILRKNVVVFIVPSAAEPPKAAKDTAACKGQDGREEQAMQRPSPLQRPRLQPRARLRRARQRPQTTRPKKPTIPPRSRKSIRWSASGSA